MHRFVDRDMIMRYHWGLAVGHVYTHGQTAALVASLTGMPLSTSVEAGEESTEAMEADLLVAPCSHPDPGSDYEDAGLGFENHEDDDLWDDEAPDELDRLDYLSDDEFINMHDTYGL